MSFLNTISSKIFVRPIYDGSYTRPHRRASFSFRSFCLIKTHTHLSLFIFFYHTFKYFFHLLKKSRRRRRRDTSQKVPKNCLLHVTNENGKRYSLYIFKVRLYRARTRDNATLSERTRPNDVFIRLGERGSLWEVRRHTEREEFLCQLFCVASLRQRGGGGCARPTPPPFWSCASRTTSSLRWSHRSTIIVYLFLSARTNPSCGFEIKPLASSRKEEGTSSCRPTTSRSRETWR